MSSVASEHRVRSTCRACGGVRLRRFLSLGPTPLANSFLRSRDELAQERWYPLDAYFCDTCSLVQLLDVIDPEVLFREYIYVTGTSDTIAAHNARYAATVRELQDLGPEDLVVEVASNDGSLLRHFNEAGVRTLGIEPATNIAALARERGVATLDRFFDREAAELVRREYGPARAVIGNNVLAHVDDTRGFLEAARELIDDGGLVIVEFPYLGEFVDRLEYDTIYHEHLSYFAVAPLALLCDEIGLSIARIDRVPVHGGSIRLYLARTDDRGPHAEDARDWIASERAAGLDAFQRYERFAKQVEESRRRLIELLASLKADGSSLAGYGAPAKGNTLLNYCRIDTELLPYTVDKSPLKVGLFTPGMGIPVLPVSTLLEDRPDYVLILAWNFAEEIISQQQEYRNRGGRFILPLPEPRVLP